jgi:trigger factor
LKEHFILEKIAEAETIEDQPEDYDREIDLIAQQSDESPRRVRSQIEKRGLMDVLRNQIIERKVIERILSHATFVDVPHREDSLTETVAVDRAAAGEEEEENPIPQAHYPNEPESKLP